MKSLPFRLAVLAVVLLVGLASQVRFAQADQALSLADPLPVDPSVKRGTLPNGLTYWVRSNKTPPGKVSVWMHVAVGSLAEETGERGLAHFIEHMAFNGTKHFPPGRAKSYFESIGMTFGQDQNAFTSWEQTTFQLDLPDAKTATLDKGLLLFSDFARRMSLLPAEIDKERGVVLEEFRMNKGPGLRLIEAILPLAFPGSRFAERLPIGIEADVKAVDRAAFARFVATFYRPDLITILVVGDVTPEQAAKCVARAFADWKAPVKRAPVPPDGIAPTVGVKAAVLTDPELPLGQVSLGAFSPRTRWRTVGDARAWVVAQLGPWILSRRLDELRRKGTAPWQDARADVDDFLHMATQASVDVTLDPARWRQGLDLAVIETKRARQHGFSVVELEDGKRSYLAEAEEAARGESTREARAWLGELNDALTDERPPMSEAQRWAMLRALLPGITVDEVNAEFRKRFAPDPRLVLVTLPAGSSAENPPTADDVLALVKKAEAKAVTPPVRAARIDKLLARDPEPGRVIQQDEDAETGIVSATFENGVRVHVRSMDYDKDQVEVRILLAGGVLTEGAADHGLAAAAGLALAQPATATWDSTQIRDYMTGRKVSVGGGASGDAWLLSVSGVPEEIEEGLRLAHVLLGQARVEAASLATWRDAVSEEAEARKSNVEMRLGEAVEDLLAAGDPRVRPVLPADAARIDAGRAQAWVNRKLLTAPLEAVLIGDMPREDGLRLLARYLGSLPTRPRIDTSFDKLRTVAPFVGPRSERIDVATITPRASLELGWLAADRDDVRANRALSVAARILTSQLIDELREKRSLIYGASCYLAPATSLAGPNRLAVSMAVAPEKADEAARVARAMVEALAVRGPTDQELRNVRKQLANEIGTEEKKPAYWRAWLGDLDYRGRKLADIKARRSDFQTYGKRDIAQALQRFVVEARRYQVLAAPAAR